MTRHVSVDGYDMFVFPFWSAVSTRMKGSTACRFNGTGYQRM